MAHVSLTRLQLRASRYLLPFMWYTWRSVRQARRTPGFRTGRLARDPHGAYWTATVWDDPAAMRAYRSAGAHLAAMPKLLHWCDEASVAHWEQEGTDLPDGAAMREKMVAIGRVSKVLHPTAAHGAGRTAGAGQPLAGPGFRARG